MEKKNVARKQGSSRRGFTLIELLVVIAIIAILIALLVPAVQKVREAAARTQCQNNLKQIGIAMQMYNDTNKKLPAGWVVNPASAGNPNPGWAWGTIILPYLEQQGLYTQMNPDFVTYAAPTVNTLTQSPLAVYRCASDGGPATNPYYQNFGTSNYVINREVLGPSSGNAPSAIAVQHIRDGTSNTVLVGERDMAKNGGATWPARSNVTSASFEGRPGRGLNIPHPNPTNPTSDCLRLGFTSLHTNGVNFLFADGTVRFLSQSIDADQSADCCAYPAATGNYTLQNLIHPSDGNTIAGNVF